MMIKLTMFKDSNLAFEILIQTKKLASKWLVNKHEKITILSTLLLVYGFVLRPH